MKLFRSLIKNFSKHFSSGWHARYVSLQLSLFLSHFDDVSLPHSGKGAQSEVIKDV